MRLQKRIDKLYDDHLDERIDDARWKAKDTEIREQQDAIQKQIAKLKSQEAKYFELWIDIIGLAFRMREIYERHKNPEDRRKLLAHIFTDLVLTDKGLSYKLKETIQKIADRVRQRIDGEKIEPLIISSQKSSKNLESTPKAVKVFRTQENPTITTLSGVSMPQTNALLRG